jgi:Transposase IS66 family
MLHYRGRRRYRVVPLAPWNSCGLICSAALYVWLAYRLHHLERRTPIGWRDLYQHAAAEVAPVVARLREMVLASTRIFADETVVPVLDPGRGRTKHGYFWAIARDDRPWAGSQPTSPGSANVACMISPPASIMASVAGGSGWRWMGGALRAIAR